MTELLGKSLYVLKNEGIKGFVDKTKRYVKRKKIKLEHCRDILFINGCSLDHPTRYRVKHQIEQLGFVGYSCDWVWYENLKMESLKNYRGFIFYRCPSTPLILEFIQKAKSFNKTTFFDIDDLVIDEKYVKTIKYLDEMSESDYRLYMDGVNRMQETLRNCDYAITTTETLAKELNNYVKETFINPNTSSEEMVQISNDVLKEKEDGILNRKWKYNT